MVLPLWFLCALGSAVIWGFGYALSEKILKNDLSVLFYMTVTGFVYFVVGLGLCLYNGQLKDGMNTLFNNQTILWTTLLTSICYVAGALLIYMAISLKNASLANIIEITYPLFTLLFAYLLFREVQLNAWTASGTFLILSGVIMIATKS